MSRLAGTAAAVVAFAGAAPVAAEEPAAPPGKRQAKSGASSEAFSAIVGAREADRAISDLRSELKERWREYAREHSIDQELDRATTDRLQDEYFAAIDEWALAAEACEANGLNRKWLPRLLKAFSRAEIERQREDVARILGALAAERMSECSAAAQERALKAERDLHAFVADRLRLVSEFFEQLEPGAVRASTRHRIARLEKGVRAQRPLADRSVSVGALRLKTAASLADPSLVDHLERDPSFQRPFALKPALSQLNSLTRAPASGTSAKIAEIKKDLAQARTEKPPLSGPDAHLVRRSTPQERQDVPAETLSTPWLLQ